MVAEFFTPVNVVRPHHEEVGSDGAHQTPPDVSPTCRTGALNSEAPEATRWWRMVLVSVPSGVVSRGPTSLSGPITGTELFGLAGGFAFGG